MKETLEYDFSEQILAKTTTSCDSCGKALGAHYARGSKNINVSLPKPSSDDADGDEPQMKDHNFCNASCLKDHLNKMMPAGEPASAS